MIRKYIAELIGTALLVYFGSDGNALVRLSRRWKQLLRWRRRDGARVRAHASGARLRHRPDLGCHVNPAVTIGALFAGRIGFVDAIGYWIAQFSAEWSGTRVVGDFSASPLYSRTSTGLGTDGWGAASHIHISASARSSPNVLTAFFVLMILRVTAKGTNAATAGVAIGLTLTSSTSSDRSRDVGEPRAEPPPDRRWDCAATGVALHRRPLVAASSPRHSSACSHGKETAEAPSPRNSSPALRRDPERSSGGARLASLNVAMTCGDAHRCSRAESDAIT